MNAVRPMTTQDSAVFTASDFKPPSFASVAEERRFLLRHLAASFRLFALYGYDEGAAGHITVRDPEHSDLFWVNPFGVHFSTIRVKDLIQVDHQGEIVRGNGLLNRAAFAIHSRLHKARPDIVAAAHSHSMHGKAFSSLGRPLLPISQDACAFYEDQVLFNSFTGVVLDTEEGDRIAASMGHCKAAILQNHGLLTTGQSVASAVHFYIAMERCAQAQLLAEAAGTPRLIPHDTAILTRGQVGSEQAGWFSFQGLYNMISRREPDLFAE